MIFSAESPFRKPAKSECKHQVIFPFVLLPSNNDSWMFSCLLSPWENGIFLNKLFTLGAKRKQVLKRAESRRCEVNTLGIFASNFSMFFKVSQRGSF